MSTQPDKPTPISRGQFAFIVWVFALLITPSALGQAPGKDETKPGTQIPHKLQGTLEIGGRAVDTSGSHTAKFQEVREVSEGVLIDNLRLDYDSVDSPYFVSAKGTELRERDQRFSIEAGRFGKYRAQFVWDQIPHFFGSGESLFQVAGPGRYQVRPDLRASLQAVTLPDAGRTPVNAALPTLVRQSLVFAPVTLVRLGRDQALFRQSYQPTDNIELYFQFSWLRNRGTRPMSAGTFVRRAVPGGGLTDIGGFWEGIGQEFLEPIDQRTTDLKVGAQFRGKRWNAGVEYELSLFRNRVDSVIFENPFRVTDE
jgi:Putative outer membrane beta-barrel porin, MtrB/PioB